MRLLLFIPAFILLLQILPACNSTKKESITAAKRFPFVADSVPDFEMRVKELADTSSETVSYELTALNHTFQTKKILFYTCTQNYGVTCISGGKLVPQTFWCNISAPYQRVLFANDVLKYEVRMYRKGLNKPKFKWKLISIGEIDDYDNFDVLDTIYLETP